MDWLNRLGRHGIPVLPQANVPMLLVWLAEQVPVKLGQQVPDDNTPSGQKHPAQFYPYRMAGLLG